ncbi:helix-turn-helix domain-containing protein [Vibrio sp. 10N.261.52.A1]|uniref:helix-turn-helix domain-containing protein n=1 Tax=Vibrio TaxID=662 RepID=UPI000C862108|nr:helix-turn-helix domain-containing protein [Vibrio sp. 10N.261.52.A1]PML43226.1 transcriptional regulator [Vibrio sp. 10N.261.52.A1]
MCVSLILSFMPLKTGSPISKLVLLKLADNADARGVCFPSLNYLAQYCEVSLRTVTRHVNELEKQGFLQRIKRFDDSGRQRSNLYQLRVPEGCHIEQHNLIHDTPQPATVSVTEPVANHNLNTAQSDTHQEANRSNTESDPLAHIISHKEHKTGLSLKTNTLEKSPAEKAVVKRGDASTTDTHSSNSKSTGITSTSTEISDAKNSDTKSPDDAVIHLLTQEGSAPIYHEFFTILESTYPNLDVLQQLHAMQAWLYINPDKRKPFEHIGHFVNGWLRRSAKAKTKQGAFVPTKRTKGAKLIKRKLPMQQAQANLTKEQPRSKHLPHQHSQSATTPVAQALAEYQSNNTHNPFEARIKALIQSKAQMKDDTE